MSALDIREVAVLIHGDTEPMAAYVAIGDFDQVPLDEHDARVFYYFEDEAEFIEAQTTGTEYFTIVRSE